MADQTESIVSDRSDRSSKARSSRSVDKNTTSVESTSKCSGDLLPKNKKDEMKKMIKRGGKAEFKDTTNAAKIVEPRQTTRRNEVSTKMHDKYSPCAKCCGVIPNEVKALQCESCAEWNCLFCTAMPESVYDAIMDNNIPNFIWTCDKCVNAVPTIKNLTSMLQGVKQEQEDSRSQMKEFHTRVEKVEESIDVKLQSAIDDYRNRESRKLNVILHNIPEPTAEQATDRKAEDKEQIADMIENGLPLEPIETHSIIRLEKKIEGKARLTKVTLDSVKNKRDVLNNAKNVRNSSTWGRVYITPDLTPRERDANKILREELKKRRDDGETGLFIRRGKILHTQQERGSEGKRSTNMAASENLCSKQKEDQSWGSAHCK